MWLGATRSRAVRMKCTTAQGFSGLQLEHEKQTQPDGNIMTASPQQLAIDQLIARVFECFDNASGTPRLETLKSRCTDDARVAKAGGPFESLADFMAPRETQLSAGSITGLGRPTGVWEEEC